MKELYSAIIISSLLLSACETEAKSGVTVEPEDRVVPGVATESVTTNTISAQEIDKIAQMETEMAENVEAVDIESFIHRQMDSGEYQGDFAPAIKGFFGDRDVRGGFCGPMTLMAIMDFMSMKEVGTPTGLGVVDMVNNYFVDETGNIKTVLNNQGLVFSSKFGMMSPASMYSMAEEIGSDLGLWNVEIVYGSTDFITREPIKKNNLDSFVKKTQEEVFDKGGVMMMHVIRKRGWDGVERETINSEYTGVKDYHFITVLDMQNNDDGTVDMLIVDSMGVEGEGFFGWVNSENYTTAYDEEPMLNSNGLPMNKRFDSKKYSGILSAFGVIPIK